MEFRSPYRSWSVPNWIRKLAGSSKARLWSCITRRPFRRATRQWSTVAAYVRRRPFSGCPKNACEPATRQGYAFDSSSTPSTFGHNSGWCSARVARKRLATSLSRSLAPSASRTIQSQISCMCVAAVANRIAIRMCRKRRHRARSKIVASRPVRARSERSRRVSLIWAATNAIFIIGRARNDRIKFEKFAGKKSLNLKQQSLYSLWMGRKCDVDSVSKQKCGEQKSTIKLVHNLFFPYKKSLF